MVKRGVVSACGLAVTILAGCANVPSKPGTENGALDLAATGLSPHAEAATGAKQVVVITIPKKTKSSYGNPERYCVRGSCYRVLYTAAGYKERGVASWYGPNFHGRFTSSREVFNMFDMTAAHKTLPIPSYAMVTNVHNGRSIIVRVNDRGPFHNGRLIDLSYNAAARLGVLQTGTSMVEIEGLKPDHTLSRAQLAKLQGAVPEELLPRSHGWPRWFVQVGAFGERSKAEQVAARLSPTLYAAVRIQSLPTSPLYRVQFGPVGSKDQVDDITAKLRKLGLVDTRIIVE